MYKICNARYHYFFHCRSGVKLLSLSGGHGDLNVLVSDIKDIKNCAKAFMNAQHLGNYFIN